MVPHLRRLAAKVVSGRAVEECRYEAIDGVPHHREVLALPASSLQLSSVQ